MKKTLSLILAITLGHFAFAQKMSSKSLSVSFHIKPSQPVPAGVVEYKSKLITPINPLTDQDEVKALAGMDAFILASEKRKEVLEEAKKQKIAFYEKNYLVIGGDKFRQGIGWRLTLETSDPTVSFVNEKSISELSNSDDVMRYTYSAVVTIEEISGKKIFEKVVSSPADEKRMTKGELLLNPVFRIKAGLNSDNPEKLKQITDKLLERKSNLVLQQILMLTGRELTAAYETQFKKFTVSIFSVKGKGFDELNDIRDKILETNMKFNAFSKKNRLPKEAMDNVLKEAIPVWEKHLASAADLDEKARKGLMLNIAFAHTWTGDYEKAEKILNEISETFVADPFEIQPVESSAPGETFLPFSTYAENLRMLFEHFRKHGEFITIYQG